MTFTFSIYSLETALARVRLRIRDTTSATAVFADEEILAFIAMEDNDWRRAAALALETIASTQLLLLKVITILDVKTDGAAMAKELRAEAQQLRDESERLRLRAEDEDGSTFEVIEMVTNDFTHRERLRDEYLRGL